ncbi:hypothetical protein [Klebsiella aerogenes]|uniref:hypothetical protein n=1 Tax=Klebsiella aerogenes TaxID=548 RepID=UPI001D190375|nr:hypothetical protein [Klebsiella aerogenes]WFW00474.1 hypothetical protein NFJ54_06725 [Klebsiella aerogenes]
MNVSEMEGFLRGKCLPGDLKVNESNAEYLVRKLRAVSELQGEVTALVATLGKSREVSGCPEGIDLQDWVKKLAAENLAIKAMNDCLSEELRGYESDGAFEGPKMHLLWWQVEFPATERIVAEAEARGVEKAINCIVQTITPNHETILKELAQQLREGDK